MTTTDQQKLLMAAILTAVNNGDPIMGKGSMPSGHVYARLMVHGELGLIEYRNLLDILKASGMITEKNHLLKVTAEGASVADEISAIIRQGESTITIN